MNARNPDDPAARFDDRVEDYARYRPGYPAAVFEHLADVADLGAGDLVVDVGAGTGLLTRGWLERGFDVCAVEPGAAMRAAAASALAAYPRLRLIDSRAESLEAIDDASAALVCAAQAFHWFEPRASARAFRRVLRRGGPVALIWNERADDADAFMGAYLELLQRHTGASRRRTAHRRSARYVAAFFAPRPVTERTFANAQRLDLAGLRGRLLSSSYAPGADQPGHEPMMADLRHLFETHQRDGQVQITYVTRVFTARLPDPV